MLVMKFLLKAIYEKYAYYLNSQEAKKIYTSKTKPPAYLVYLQFKATKS